MAELNVEHLAAVWRSIGELCSGLDDEQWHLGTSCPGWTVKDHLSHLVGPEALFLGRPQPAALEVPPPHVRNPIGAANEAAVEYRRSWPGDEVLAEFVEVSGLRLEQLDALTEEDLNEESWTPAGPGTYRDLIAIRAFDAWVHEQDMRQALGMAGDTDTPAAAHALGRCLLAMPYVVGKKAAAPDGATVVFEVTGPISAELGIEVSGGRAMATSTVPEEPTVRLQTDLVTFTRLGCGRSDPVSAVTEGTLTITGDEPLGTRIVENISFMI